MIRPTIHMNGTAPETLRDEYLAVAHSIRDAVKKAEGMDFNGRDYYPQGDAAWQQAKEEHHKRINDLNVIWLQFEELAGHCQHAIYDRAKRRAERMGA